MTKVAFKKLEVCDLFTPERIASFERPHEQDDTLVIHLDGKDFHLGAPTLETIAAVLAKPKIQN
jgi:hypothetical protein